MQTTGISAKVYETDTNWIRGSAILPTYLLNISLSGRTLHVAVNGQTGRVAVERLKKRETGKNAWILPTIVFIAICICWGVPFYVMNGAYGLLLLLVNFPIVCLIHRIISSGSEKHRLLQFIMQGDAVMTKRNGSQLQILPSNLPPSTETPIFFETIYDIETPVKIVLLYNRTQRIIKTLLSLLIAFHPWIYAGLYATLKNIKYEPTLKSSIKKRTNVGIVKIDYF